MRTIADMLELDPQKPRGGKREPNSFKVSSDLQIYTMACTHTPKDTDKIHKCRKGSVRTMWTTQLHTETSSQNTTDPLAMTCVCECDSGNIDRGPGKPELYLEARGREAGWTERSNVLSSMGSW